MKKLLIYYNFIIVSLMVVIGFVSAGSPVQLVTSILFFPLFVFFALQVLPKRSKAIHIPEALAPVTKKSSLKTDEKEDGEVVKLKKEGVDVDRRAFLKIIGTAGLSLFLFSLFTKKAEAAFFGSVPGPGVVSIKDTQGNKIDPAEKQPTDGYRINQLDDSIVTYYGLTNKDGAWFIMQEDTDTGAFRYAKGSSNFATNWDNRGTLTYDYYDNVF